MPYTGDGKQAMLEALKTKSGFLSAWQDTTLAQTWTGVAATGILTSNSAHGLETGELIYLSAQTGATVGNITVLERFFYVKKVSATEIELSMTASFVKETWTTNLTTATVHVVKEVASTRVANVWAELTKDELKQTAAATITIAGACTVNWIGYNEKLKLSEETPSTFAGKPFALAKVTAEVFAAAGSYEVKASTLDLLAASVA